MIINGYYYPRFMIYIYIVDSAIDMSQKCKNYYQADLADKQ